MHVKGVINLRGQVIPVIDLRAKVGMETTDVTEETCIIVVLILELRWANVVTLADGPPHRSPQSQNPQSKIHQPPPSASSSKASRVDTSG